MNFEEEKRGLKIMHFALCMGALLIIMLLHFSVTKIDLGTTGNSLSMVEMVALGLAGMNLIVANLLFSKSAVAIGNGEIKEDNILRWRQAYILKWAFLEGAILVNILIYTFFGNNAILAIVALLMLLLLYISKPKFD